MNPYTQVGKPMRLKTPLPDDTLMIERLAGEEAVSEPYTIHLDLLSTDSAVDPATLLRKPVSIVIDLESGDKRFMHGVVRRFIQLGRANGPRWCRGSGFSRSRATVASSSRRPCPTS
jgi:uncharacterized protein involved in type VI secretion and phage assembly